MIVVRPGTYISTREDGCWRSFTIFTDSRVEFIDAADGHVSMWNAGSPEGASWRIRMERLLVTGELARQEGQP